MRYAKLVNTIPVDYNVITRMINIGDSIITSATDNLLRYAGIDSKEVIELPMYGKCCAPEPCYFIAQGHLGRQYDMSFMDDPNISPVFIGFALKDSYLLEKEIAYFKRFEPILCRDEFTKNVLQRYDIEAYISGCITLTLPKRNEADGSKRNKYFFVDIHESFQKLIPEDIKENAVFTSQNIKIEMLDKSAMKNNEEVARQRLEEYKSFAKMVITSKLHCMVPCIAMGIPVIAVGNNFSYRYSFADTFIDSYNIEQLEFYDWSIPREKVDIEGVKKLFLDVGKSMLQHKPDIKKIQELDNIYTGRMKWEYCQGIKRYLREIFENEKIPEYILWGASSGGYAVNEVIKELWPESRLLEVVDTFAEGIFSGKTIKRPSDVLGNYPDTKIIISTLSGRESAEQFLKTIGKRENIEYYFVHENM